MFSRSMQVISASLILLSILLLLIGCGGGGRRLGSTSAFTPVSVTAVRTSGKALLPPGFSLAPTSLTVVSGVDSAPLKADGSFSLRSGGTGQALVVLRNPAGKAVLFGFVDNASSGSPQAGGNGEISAKQTSIALLFYTLGMFTLPAGQWQHARDVIAQLPQTSQLAAMLTTRMASDPTALGDGDPQIASTIVQARQAIQPGSRSVSTASSRTQTTEQRGPAVTTVTVSRVAGDPSVLIDPSPSEQQSGVNMNPSPDGTGIVLVNHARRRAAVFVYETATVDSQGIQTNLDAPKPMSFPTTTLVQALFTPGNVQPVPFLEVAPANTLNGVFGSLADVTPALAQQLTQPDQQITDGAWVAQSTDPILLPPDGGAAKTIYKVVLVGPSFSQKNNVMTSFLATDPQFHLTTFAPQWQKVVNTLSNEEVILDLILPIVSSLELGDQLEGKLEAIRSSSLKGSGNLNEDVALFQDFLAIVGSAPDLATTIANINNGDFTAAVKSFVQVAVDSGDVRDRIAKWFLKDVLIDFPPDVTGTIPVKNGTEVFGAKLETFSGVASKVDLFLALLDTTRVTHDTIGALPVTSWNVTVLPGKVSLSPATATVDSKQSTVSLTVSIQGSTDLSPFRFVWSTTGTQGHLTTTAAGNIPLPTGPIADQNVVYVTDLLKLKDGQSDTVTVKVFQASDLKTAIGTATSTISAPSTINCNNIPPNGTGFGRSNIAITWDKQLLHSGDVVTGTVTLRGKGDGVLFFTNGLVDQTGSVAKPLAQWSSQDGGVPPDVRFNGITLFIHKTDASATEVHKVQFTLGKVAFTMCDGNVGAHNDTADPGGDPQIYLFGLAP